MLSVVATIPFVIVGDVIVGRVMVRDDDDDDEDEEDIPLVPGTRSRFMSSTDVG